MQNFDVALKEIFQTIGTSLTVKLAGADPAEWLNVELPETRNPRADFVYRLVTGLLFHTEFASHNDAELIWRMLDYLSMLRKKYGQVPRQVVLYMAEILYGCRIGLRKWTPMVICWSIKCKCWTSAIWMLRNYWPVKQLGM